MHSAHIRLYFVTTPCSGHGASLLHSTHWPFHDLLLGCLGHSNRSYRTNRLYTGAVWGEGSGIPFGDSCQYAEFEDCVRAHKDKRDPEAYCAQIMRATEDHCKKKAQIELVTRARDLREALRPIGRRPWTWDEDNARYVDADGNVLPAADQRGLLARFLENQRERAERLTERLIGGQLLVTEWESEMRWIIKDAYGAAYMLGRGGRFQMTFRDWGFLGRALSEQYRYLNNFAAQLVAGSVTEGRTRMRANLYPLSARQVMSRGSTYALGGPELPAHPGDGSSECLGNDGCWWDLESTTLGDGSAGWNAFWRRTKTDSCVTCIRREREWAPLVVRA